MNNLFGDLFGILFFLVFYIPINIVVMLIAAVIFNLVNKAFRLQFPAWVVATAAAIMVFVLMVALVGGGSKHGELDFSDLYPVFYISTFIINVLVVLIMLSASRINKLIFKNQVTSEFVFGKSQKIATTIYTLAIVSCATLPFIRQGKAYISEKQTEKNLQTLKVVVDTDDKKAFEDEASQNYRLWEVKLPGEQKCLFEYLLTHNKPEMVHLLLKDKPEMFTYAFDWDIHSPEMLQTLMQDGMNANRAVDILTRSNRTDLVKKGVTQYKPRFDTLVSFITENVVNNNNTVLLDYLIQNGLTKEKDQTSETLYWLASENNFDAIKLLVNKGFAIDTANVSMIYSAIYNGNLPMLKFLFTYPFDVNTMNDEYTNVENAIIGDKQEIFDFLLTLKPDINTLHETKLNGETNALQIAERYKQLEMLEKLKRYAG